MRLALLAVALSACAAWQHPPSGPVAELEAYALAWDRWYRAQESEADRLAGAGDPGAALAAVERLLSLGTEWSRLYTDASGWVSAVDAGAGGEAPARARRALDAIAAWLTLRGAL